MSERTISSDTGRVGGIPARLFWPGMVVALISISLCFAGVTAFIALTDPSFAVEPDYYEKALRWDESREQSARNDELDWRVRIEVAGTTDALGRREVRLTALDADGRPLEEAAASVEMFHHARSSQRLTATLTESTPGVFVGPLPIAREGLWEVRFEIRRAADAFTGSAEVRVAGGPPR
ncbi:MAG TPA: FixH family protein [Phycisphaerales bacterium]|nr:FixH family protein [Phycisphaerales bacterium]